MGEKMLWLFLARTPRIKDSTCVLRFAEERGEGFAAKYEGKG